MAFMKILLSLIPLFSNALLLPAAVENPKAITVELIHPFSPHSPFYPGNLTNAEKSDLLTQDHEVFMHHLFTTMREGNSNGNSEVDYITAKGKFSGFYFVAQVNIGSFSGYGLPYFLLMDTGSELTWVQCERCNPCFSLSRPNFPYENSKSFRPIRCGDPTCPTPKQQCFQSSSCGFRVQYQSSSGPSAVGPSTAGKILRETLYFPSSFGGMESYHNLFLGCALQNHNYMFSQPNEIAGVLGLGRGGPGSSGILPLWTQVGKKRFSYCLHLEARLGTSRLYIGGGKMVLPLMQKTPLIAGPNPSQYYLVLHDIGIQNVPVGLQRSDFGDSTIDVGASTTSLAHNAYARVRVSIVRYFAQFHIQPYGSHGRPRGVPTEPDLCFPNRRGFTGTPALTFYFGGAHLVVVPSVVFETEDNYICLLLRSGTKTRIGAYQQTRYMFSYDFEEGDRRRGEIGELRFAPFSAQRCESLAYDRI